MAGYLFNHWYAAARSDDVRRELLSRALLGESLVLYRTAAGAVVALIDRCAHRFARLSQGRLCGDHVACPYHGMEYGSDGVCKRIPGQERVPDQARVRAFPTLERFGLVFVWMGEPSAADPARLIDIPQYGSTRWGISCGYAKFNCNWRLVMDNLIDPAHTSFVHQHTIGNAAGDDVPLQVELVRTDTICCGRWINDAPAVPIVQRFANPAGHVDRWQFYYVTLPTTSLVDFGSMATGRPHSAQEQDRAPYRVLSYAFLTPFDDMSTHYFSLQLRNFAAADDRVTEEFNALYHATFEEDRVLLEAIQQAEMKQPELKSMFIASDSGVARLRRMLAELESQP